MSAQTALALLLALASTTLTNVAYLREHDAAAALPALSLRRPLHSVQALLTDRSWLVGFALESCGFALYVAALALAPLTLVQSVSAGGIGILAFVSARRKFGKLAVVEGLAGGLFFSIGDISVKVATQGGVRAVFAVAVIAGYALGTAFLQLGYQKGGALTVAGLATLLTNALPIAAGSVVLGEPVPSGVYGGVRVAAFAAVTLGAILLAQPDRSDAQVEPTTASVETSPAAPRP